MKWNEEMKKKKPITSQINRGAKQLRELSKRMTQAMKPTRLRCRGLSPRHAWAVIDAANSK